MKEAFIFVESNTSGTGRLFASTAVRLGLVPVMLAVDPGRYPYVRLCRTLGDTKAHAALLLDCTVNERGMPQIPEVLVEEYMTGPEYSVEILGNSVIGICAKHISTEPFFVETGHDFPAPLSKPVARQISQLALSSARAMGLEWGPAHIEIRNAPEGPAIVEINPRLAGGFIPELVRLATGIDLIEAVLRLSVGEEAPLRRTVQRHASIRFIMPPADGVLRSVTEMGTGSMQNEVSEIRMYRKPGENVRIHHDFRDRIGHAIACAETGMAARETAVAARDQVRICIS